MRARMIHPETPLVRDGWLDVTIIYSSAKPAYEQLAQELASAIQQDSGSKAELLADRAVMPAVNQPLPNEYRRQPLILLGNLNNNRALLPLYTRYYSFTNALHPGGDGHDLRTLVLPFLLDLGLDPDPRQKLYAWPDVPLAISLPNDPANGRAALAPGCYSVVVFLDVDGRIIGHSWADAPWIFNIFPVPAGQPGEGDLYVGCGWKHGIGYYDGQAGTEPSGEWLVFGGVRQPMFRPLRKISPFVNGRTAAFDWFTGNIDLGRVIVAAADGGLGVFSTATRNFIWKVEGGATITACLPTPTRDGQGQVMIGGVDGFVASFALLDGKPLRRWWAGAPVVGLAHLAEAGTWVAATRQGVWTLDTDWNVKAFFPVKAVALCKTSGLQIIVACQDGSLVSLQNAG